MMSNQEEIIKKLDKMQKENMDLKVQVVEL